MRNRLREKRPKQLRMGAMQVEPTRYDRPSFFRALLSAGLVDQNTQPENAWGIWDSVCRDAEVIRLSNALEKSKKVFLPSVAAAFSNGTQVLKMMNQKQVAALKLRIGVRKEETK